jgi:hypothetical protein
LYLLQLVQALKFESAANDQRSTRAATNAISYEDSGLADFLIHRGVQHPVLGNRLYWYLMVEVALEDRVMAKMYGRIVFKFMNEILKVRPFYIDHAVAIAEKYCTDGRWFRAKGAAATTRSLGRFFGKTCKGD